MHGVDAGRERERRRLRASSRRLRGANQRAGRLTRDVIASWLRGCGLALMPALSSLVSSKRRCPSSPLSQSTGSLERERTQPIPGIRTPLLSGSSVLAVAQIIVR